MSTKRQTIESNRPLRVLLVEDSENDARLILRELTRGGFAVLSQCVDNSDALRDALRSKSWDVVLSDYVMPRFSGAEALTITRKSGYEMPFIFVSGSMGEDFAVEAMKVGAHDYITKDNLKRLVPAINYSLKAAIRESRRRDAEARLQYLAHYDLLTKLPNRALFNDRLEQALHDARRRSTLLAVAFLDLNRFKSVNDSLGHEAGDLLLQAVARRLKLRLRASDTVSRISGDEFTFILPEVTNTKDAESVVEKILGAFATPFKISNQELYIDASLGVAFFPTDAQDRQHLLRNADAAMYHAKKKRGSQYQFCTPEITSSAALRLEIENALGPALKKGEFDLHYQPQVQLPSGKIEAMEALIRWMHPKHGLIDPEKFIPVSEETGFISELGEWVFRRACLQVQEWNRHGIRNLRIAVNCSAHQFHQQKLHDIVTRILAETGAKPECLEIEITESVFMQDSQLILTIMKRFRDWGIRITMDDFGTGFSSLSYLKRLPLNSLKIDRSFVRDVPADSNCTAITSAIIAMSRKLGIEVIAEGVETREQMEFLKSEGCYLMQGFYLRRPLPAHGIEKDLKTGTIEIA